MSTSATAIAIAKTYITRENIKKVVEAIEKMHAAGMKDYEAWKSLNNNFSVVITGTGIGKYNFKNEHLEIISSDDGSKVVITVFSFEWFQKLWNGVSLLKDKDDGGYEASLIHDLISTYAGEIAAANGVKKREVDLWSDKILIVVWRFYAIRKGKYGLKLKIKHWAILNCLYVAPRNLWSKIMQSAVIILIALTLAGCSEGCVNTKDYEVESGSELDFSEKPIE